MARRATAGLLDALDEILALDGRRRVALSEVNDLKAQRNEVSKEVGRIKRDGGEADQMIVEMREVGARISEIDEEVARAEERIEELMLLTPNLPLDEVPSGGVEQNEIVRVVGTPPEFDFEPKPHWDLGSSLGLLDLERGSKISGSGFPLLTGLGARLQRCLIDFMLDLHTQDFLEEKGWHGYTELRVPYLVTRDTLSGTGQLPKFADESYQTERDDLWLIPTAEVPVTNLHRDELLSVDDLPVRYAAYSPCFRREAGAAGADTRGLLRVHQFDKVELVRYETPERSRDALEELTGEAEKHSRSIGFALSRCEARDRRPPIFCRDDLRHRSLGARGRAVARGVELQHVRRPSRRGGPTSVTVRPGAKSPASCTPSTDRPLPFLASLWR